MTESASELEPSAHELPSSIRSFHWFVIALSIGLTSGAWWIARSQHQELVETRFERERDQLVELIQERMQKYEDALWSGNAAVQANNGAMSHVEWAKYAHNLALESRYPGISGVGIVLRVERDEKAEFVASENLARPEFSVFPEHPNDPLYPIVVVEPLATNAKAVGLDIAFETNRRTGLERSISEGTAQVTGPITLVQDDTKTPGFLFYAPYYEGGIWDTAAEREEHFVGAVYAPFVTSQLMEGTLRRESRHVLIGIRDGGEQLFDELTPETENYDPSPMFKDTLELGLYGRTWVIETQTDAVFRSGASSSQSTVILVGGICIDAMLFAFFLMLSRSRRRAVTYAQEVTREIQLVNHELTEQQDVLLRSNAELEQFAYVASHDLQEPLRMVRSYSELLKEDLEGSLTEMQEQDLGFLTEGAQRMQTLVDDLLQFSRVDSKASPYTPMPLHLETLVDEVVHDLGSLIKESKAELRISGADTWVTGDAGQLRQVLQNLITNAIKFQAPGTVPRVEVCVVASSEDELEISVKDNGIGIAPEMQTRVFQIFQRLNTRREYEGSGLGLAIVKKIVERNGGQVRIESALGEGCDIRFTAPSAAPEECNV